MKRLLLLTCFLIVSVLLTAGEIVNVDHLEFLRGEFSVKDQMVFGYWIYTDRQPDGSFKRVGAEGEGVTCVDDVARVAVFYLREIERKGIDPFLDSRARESLKFVLKMQDHDGDFFNFVFEDGTINKHGPTSRKGGNWWAARAYWALSAGARVYSEYDIEYSEILASAARRAFRVLNSYVEDGLLHGYADMTSVMLLGAAEYAALHRDEAVLAFIGASANALSNRLVRSPGLVYGLFDEGIEDFNWNGWGSREIEALVAAYEVTANEAFLDAAVEAAKTSVPMLLSLGPVYRISRNVVLYEQIAYAAEVHVNGLHRLFNATDEDIYGIMAAILNSWFLGMNHLRLPMVGPNGEGLDGLERTHRNLNAGAESTISMLLSFQAVERLPAAIRAYSSVGNSVRTPGYILEAETLDFGLSPAQIIRDGAASGGALVSFSDTLLLRTDILLPGVDYEVHVSLFRCPADIDLEFTVRYGAERVTERLAAGPNRIIKIGEIRGTGEAARLSVSARIPAGRSVEIDQLILVPAVVGIYSDNHESTMLFNRSLKERDGLLGMEYARAEGDPLFVPFDEERVERYAVELIDKNGVLHAVIDPLLNNKGMALPDERREANFDNFGGVVGASYPQREIERLLKDGLLFVDDVSFMMAFGEKDNFRLMGQRVNLSVEASQICFLGSSEQGDYEEYIELVYDDGSVHRILLGFSDWCGISRFGEKIAASLPFRYDNAGNVERIQCRLYVRCYNIPEGRLAGIGFPERVNIHVFAITFVK